VGCASAFQDAVLITPRAQELQGFDRMSHRELVCDCESSDGFEERESR
jgi:hypothetical protein